MASGRGMLQHPEGGKMISQEERLHRMVDKLDDDGKTLAENFLKTLVKFEQLQFEIARLYQDTEIRELYNRLVVAGHEPATILKDYACKKGIALS